MAVVVGIVYLSEAGIEPDRTGINERCRAVIQLSDQVTRKGIDVHPIGDIPDRVAIADNIVGVRPGVTYTGCKDSSEFPLH